MSAARRRSLYILALAAAMVLMATAPSLAHASLVQTDPADGSEVEALPETVTFTFSEQLDESAFASVLVDGHPVTLPAGDPVVDGETVRVDLSGVTAQGRDWTVAYRVVSADGHPIEGSSGFSIAGAEVNDDPIVKAGADEEQSWWAEPWPWVIAGIVVVAVAFVLVRGRKTR